jgi:iron-sulfur cluster insertion protein
MTASVSYFDPNITVTDQAAQKVRELLADENNPALNLRVYITGGGCSGFQYGFTFDDLLNEDDVKVKNQDIVLLVDAMSVQYLIGATIDYKSDVQGERFVIQNPNAKTTCGCGSSFSV